MATKKKPARKAAPIQPNPFDGVIEQLTNERSPQWWVDELEAAAKEILGKHSVEVDVSSDPFKPKYRTISSAEAPGFALPKSLLAREETDKERIKAEAARRLMHDLRNLKRLLSDRSDKARDVTIGLAIMLGINAAAMELRPIAEVAQAGRKKASKTRADRVRQEVEEFRIEYQPILDDEKFRNEHDRWNEWNKRRKDADKPTLSFTHFNRRRKDTGFSRKSNE